MPNTTNEKLEVTANLPRPDASHGTVKSAVCLAVRLREAAAVELKFVQGKGQKLAIKQRKTENIFRRKSERKQDLRRIAHECHLTMASENDYGSWTYVFSDAAANKSKLHESLATTAKCHPLQAIELTHTQKG